MKGDSTLSRVTVSVAGPTGNWQLEADAKGMLIGRQGDCDIALDSPLVSRKHTRLYRDPFHRWIAIQYWPNVEDKERRGGASEVTTVMPRPGHLSIPGHLSQHALGFRGSSRLRAKAMLSGRLGVSSVHRSEQGCPCSQKSGVLSRENRAG